MKSRVAVASEGGRDTTSASWDACFVTFNSFTERKSQLHPLCSLIKKTSTRSGWHASCHKLQRHQALTKSQPLCFFTALHEEVFVLKPHFSCSVVTFLPRVILKSWFRLWCYNTEFYQPIKENDCCSLSQGPVMTWCLLGLLNYLNDSYSYIINLPQKVQSKMKHLHLLKICSTAISFIPALLCL